MRGSTRQISMLKMKKTLIEILNGLWNKNKARRIFLAARLHLPTPASADGRGSPGSALSHLSLPLCSGEWYKKIGKHTFGWKRECTPTQGSLKNHPWNMSRTLVPLLSTENLSVLQKCHPGAPEVAWWEYPIGCENDLSLLRPLLLLIKDTASPTRSSLLDFFLESQMVAVAPRHQHYPAMEMSKCCELKFLWNSHFKASWKYRVVQCFACLPTTPKNS